MRLHDSLSLNFINISEAGAKKHISVRTSIVTCKCRALSAEVSTPQLAVFAMSQMQDTISHFIPTKILLYALQ